MQGLPTIVPCVASFLAFLLGILCLFSGTQRQCLPQADILTLHLDSMTSPITGAPDFFSVYVMSYCEGITEECVTNGTNETSLVTTIRSCSDRNVLFSFNPTAALTEILGHSPGDAWPSYLSDDFEALAPTSRIMAVFYVIGISTAGLAILVKLWSIWRSGPRNCIEKPPSTLLFLILLVSLLSLGISSVMANVMATEFVDLINRSGASSGVTADHGSSFLGMSWAAVALQMVGLIIHSLAIAAYRSRHCHCDTYEPEPAEKPLVDTED